MGWSGSEGAEGRVDERGGAESERGADAANTSRTEEGERRGVGGPVRFVSFVPSWFEAYRSRGPGRTILLDLCARAISRSSRDLPRATNIVAITSCSWLFALAGP